MLTLRRCDRGDLALKEEEASLTRVAASATGIQLGGRRLVDHLVHPVEESIGHLLHTI